MQQLSAVEKTQENIIMYEQQLMREHLCKCFESRKMSFFPVKKYRRPQYHATVINEEFFEVFCFCRMPEMFVNENWVECSKCSEWFHFDTCVSISEKARKPSSFGTVILVKVVTPCLTASYDDTMKLTSYSAVTVHLSL